MLCLVSAASAEGGFGTFKPLSEMNQDEWNLWCTAKTNQEYVAEYMNTETWEMEYTVLPSGTYCSVSSSIPGSVIIRYMKDGELKDGIIPEDGVISCVSSYRDGYYAHNVHELDPNHDRLLQTHPVTTLAESVVLSGTTDYSKLNFENPENWPQGTEAYQAAQLTAGRTPENAAQMNASIQAEWYGTKQPSASAPAPTTAPDTVPNAAPTTAPVTNPTASTHTSSAATQPKPQSYASTIAYQPMAETVPDDHHTASICSPQSGTAMLRQAPSESSYVVKYCETGTLVTVLQYGSAYCGIEYQGVTGYILTAALKFYPDAEQPIATGILHMNGDTSGGSRVNIRSQANTDCVVAAVWPTGSQVKVYAHSGDWYEVEHGGKRGYVHQSLINIQ